MNSTKPILQSGSVNGVMLTLVCLVLGLTGRHIDKDMLSGTIAQGQEVWLVLTGASSLVVAAWARIKLWKFHRPNIQEPATWAAIIGLVGSVGSLLGLPPEALTDMQHAIDQVGGLAVSGKVAGVALNVFTIVRALISKQKLTTLQAQPL